MLPVAFLNVPMLSIFQGEHMIFILLAILLLFGGKKIPELMRGLGKGVREFNDAKNNVRQELENGLNQPTAPTQQQAPQAPAATTTNHPTA